MSNGQLRAAIERMEAWVADPSWEADPETLAQWNAEFQAAAADVQKGEDWPDLAARGHALARRLEARMNQLARLRDEVRAELDAQERGSRALKGYGANTR